VAKKLQVCYYPRGPEKTFWDLGKKVTSEPFECNLFWLERPLEVRIHSHEKLELPENGGSQAGAWEPEDDDLNEKSLHSNHFITWVFCHAKQENMLILQ